MVRHKVRIVFQVLFCLHLLVTAAMVIFITVYGLNSDSRNPNFHPWKWYPQLLAATVSAGITAFMWQRNTYDRSPDAFKEPFWLSPILTSLMALMLMYIGTALSVSLAVLSFASALAQLIYGVWVAPRFEYATDIFWTATALPPDGTRELLAPQSIAIGVLYCCFLVLGIGGATALDENKTKSAIFFILVIMLSMFWTMQFLKNVIQLTVSSVKYIEMVRSVTMDINAARCIAIRGFSGRIAMGSILVPVMTLFRSFALLMGFTRISTVLAKCGNRWGFLCVGVYNSGFVQASSFTWEMFTRDGMVPLIESDLIEPFCFLSGLGVGAVCSMVSGFLSLVLHQSYAVEVSIYAFFIGYFMCRLALGWQEASVAAYYVAYMVRPSSRSIRRALEQIQRSQAGSSSTSTSTSILRSQVGSSSISAPILRSDDQGSSSTSAPLLKKESEPTN
ncbi:hypothetical protein PIB30_035789 [Stylosanthes scabra]|uniref:Choline transporter-like protein n=1 Tax=Stylosanthes scabra TaxID=79078 RepID=A0ABU6VFC8_9FABA|nr:hypothetical protein [Stylosanthes scabra]